MPVNKVEARAPQLRVRKLKLDFRNNDYQLSLQCEGASTYLICYGSDHPSNWIDKLSGLDDETINRLVAEESFEYEGLKLQGVSVKRFHASSSFRDIRIEPPGWLQVLAITVASRSSNLFIPVDKRDIEESCVAVPVYYCYRTEDRPDGKTMLIIDMAEQESRMRYKDGELQYRVEGYPPIPVPRSCLGVKLCIPNRQGARVTAEPDQKSGNKYQLFTYDE